MTKQLATLTLLLTLAFSTLAETQTPSSLLQLTPNQHAAALYSALEAGQTDQAFLHARAWKRTAPGQIPPLTALASVYLAFDAPAAALDALESALALQPAPAERRRLLALKTQTLVEAGEPRAAWANARSYLRSDQPDDPFAPILSQVQWRSLLELSAAEAYAAHLERIQKSSTDAYAEPLTADTIRQSYPDITAELYQNVNNAYSDGEAAVAGTTKTFLRYLLAAHYLNPYENETRTLQPIYDYPDSYYIVRQEANAPNPDPIALSLTQWARINHRHDSAQVARPPEPRPDPNLSETERIEAFLATADKTWNAIAAHLPPLLEKAEQARNVEEIESALGTLIRFNTEAFAPFQSKLKALKLDLANLLWKEKIPAANHPLSQKLAAWENKLTEAPLAKTFQQRLAPDLAGETDLSLPRKLALTFLAQAEVQLKAPLERIQNTATPALEDFDILIARGLMTPELWSRRLAAAEQSADWPEIAWSGIEAHGDDPEKLQAWNARVSDRQATFVERNDALIAQSLQTLQTGTDEQKATAMLDLEQALVDDPGHIEGLTALYQLFEQAGQNDYAVRVLERVWRLNPSTLEVDDSVLALAARVSNWPLLLSLSHNRILKDNTDPVALLHRQIASLALGLEPLVRDSTHLLYGSLYEHQARLLHAMSHPLKTRNATQFKHATTGLAASIQSLGTAHDSLSARLWLALGLKHNPKLYQAQGLSWEKLLLGASPALSPHLNYLAGRADRAAYLAEQATTDGEGVSIFLTRFDNLQKRDSGNNRRQLAKLNDRTDLPLFFKALAHSYSRSVTTPSPLRPSDPFFVQPDTKNWESVWSNLAPGQALVATGKIELPKDPNSIPILRLTRLPSTARITLPTKLPFTSTLWELDGVEIPSFQFTPDTWMLQAQGVVALQDSIVTNRAFTGQGSLWIESSDIVRCQADVQRLYLTNVDARKSAFHLAEHWQANRLRSHDSLFALNPEQQNAAPASGLASNSVFINPTQSPFATSTSSAHTTIRDSEIHSEKELGLPAEQISLPGSRITLAQSIGESTTKAYNATPLNISGPADFQVATMSELYRAVATAKKGQRIELAPGEYTLTLATLQIPDGVVLRGSSNPQAPSVIQVGRRSHLNPVVNLSKGAAQIENVLIAIGTEERMIDGQLKRIGGETLSDRIGLRAEKNTRLILRNVRFDYNWAHYNELRSAIRSAGAQVITFGPLATNLSVSQNGTISHFSEADADSRSSRLSGRGEIQLPNAFPGSLNVSGRNLRFYGNTERPNRIAYENGAGDAKTKAGQNIARQIITETLTRFNERHHDSFKSLPSSAERIALFSSLARELAPRFPIAQMTNTDLATLLQRSLSPVMLQKPAELPFYFAALYDDYSAQLPISSYLPYFRSFSEADQEQLRLARVARGERFGAKLADLSATRRMEFINLLQDYPIGSPYHAQAIQAFQSKQDLASFRASVKRAEDARRLQAQLRADREREWLRQQEIMRRQAQAQAQARAQPKKPTWWETYSAQYPNGHYNSRNSTGGSATQQMRNFRKQLNNKIYNSGRDYGKQYQF